MKSLLLTFTLLLSLAGASLAAFLRQWPLPHPTATVYVCMSKTSYAYHSSDACNGLNCCSHPLKTMPTAEAEKLGKQASHKYS